MSRITGTEMEWPVTIHPPGESPRQITDVEQAKLVKEGMPDEPVRMNAYLKNGARFYRDVNEHPEYASPEDDSYLGTTANEIVGEQYMQRVIDTLAAAEPKRSPFRTITHNKRVVADDGSTWGYHENYNALAALIEVTEQDLALLGLHMATRNILFGAGVLRPDGGFWIAQKAVGINCGFTKETVKKKPVVNLRDKPLADGEYFRRIHVTSGDPTMSPWATRMKLGTTALVLSLIENREVYVDSRTLSGVADTMVRISKSVTLDTHEIRTSEFFSYALTIQKAIIDYVKQLQDISPEESWTIEQWEKGLADLEQDPQLLEDRSDWVGKLMLLDQLQEKTGLPWDSEQMRLLERLWSSFGPRSYGLRYRQGRWAKWMPPENLIKERMNNPPQTTRAKLRGDFIDAFQDIEHAGARWDACVVGADQYKLSNPYDPHHESLERCIKAQQARREERSKRRWLR